MTILYVDDDLEDAEIFCEAINVIDASVICKTIYESSDVVKEITLLCPDYIFLDFRMPGMDGLDLLKLISAHDCFKKSKVIMCSTFMFEKDIEECKKLGVYDCWKKSTEFALLCNDLRTLFQGST